VEAPLDVASAMEAARAGVRGGLGLCVIIVDCITLWITNLMLAEEEGSAEGLEETILVEARALVATARRVGAHVVLVSNEVGLGVVPATWLGRTFRDISGRVHQLLAHAADEVFVMWAGLPQRIK
jgi:adenosylcobinamide kinase/adenosylcobinamide-phosphate guanylyltransferase